MTEHAKPLGYTALSLCCNSRRRGFQPVVEALLAHRADVNAATPSGATPLLQACACGWQDVARVLLSARADVGATNVRGKTALDLRVWGGRGAIVMYHNL